MHFSVLVFSCVRSNSYQRQPGWETPTVLMKKCSRWWNTTCPPNHFLKVGMKIWKNNWLKFSRDTLWNLQSGYCHTGGAPHEHRSREDSQRCQDSLCCAQQVTGNPVGSEVFGLRCVQTSIRPHQKPVWKATKFFFPKVFCPIAFSPPQIEQQSNRTGVCFSQTAPAKCKHTLNDFKNTIRFSATERSNTFILSFFFSRDGT